MVATFVDRGMVADRDESRVSIPLSRLRRVRMFIGGAALMVFNFAVLCAGVPMRANVQFGVPNNGQTQLAVAVYDPTTLTAPILINQVFPAVERRVDSDSEQVSQLGVPASLQAFTIDMRRKLLTSVLILPTAAYQVSCSVTDPLPITAVRVTPSK
jgi:hypothetical protein